MRLVQNDDGTVARNDVDGSAALEVVQLLIDAPCVCAARIERLNVDDHDVDGARRGKLLDLIEALGVVDKEPRLFAVCIHEVVLRHFKGLLHALADGDAGDNDNEFGKTVALVELKHGLDIHIRLARARLHFHIEIDRPELV